MSADESLPKGLRTSSTKQSYPLAGLEVERDIMQNSGQLWSVLDDQVLNRNEWVVAGARWPVRRGSVVFDYSGRLLREIQILDNALDGAGNQLVSLELTNMNK